MNEKYFKVIFLDTGLACAALGLTLDLIYQTHDIELINKGGIAEQVIGQLLRTIEPLYKEPALYCWHRTEKQSNAEIDYIVQHKNRVIPIEVKAGSTGSLKSLHLFIGMKKIDTAVRFNSDTPSVATINTRDLASNSVQFKLISLPLYLISELHRLL